MPQLHACIIDNDEKVSFSQNIDGKTPAEVARAVETLNDQLYLENDVASKVVVKWIDAHE